jgi:hypothetical protein
MPGFAVWLRRSRALTPAEREAFDAMTPAERDAQAVAAAWRVRWMGRALRGSIVGTIVLELILDGTDHSGLAWLAVGVLSPVIDLLFDDVATLHRLHAYGSLPEARLLALSAAAAGAAAPAP